MSKYIDAEKLISEILKLRSESCISESDDYYEYAKSEIIDIIESLESEKQMNQELEAEMDKFFETMPVLEHENIFEDTFKNIARHFYELGKNDK